jgi:hypothetical protein
MASLGSSSGSITQPFPVAKISPNGHSQIHRKCSPQVGSIQGKFCCHLELPNLSDMIGDG